MRACGRRLLVLGGLLLSGCSSMQVPAPVEDRDYRKAEMPRPRAPARIRVAVPPADGREQPGPRRQMPAGLASPLVPESDDARPTAPAREAARPAAPPVDRGPEAGPAVLALLHQASAYARDGDAGRASAAIERAIRIEPGNPWLWHRFAVLRLQQHDWGQALELAGKSNALAMDDSRLQLGNWRVIAAAHRGAGNHEAALRARLRIEELEQRLGP